MLTSPAEQPRAIAGSGHSRWVRVTHWIVAASVLTLAVSGFVILMAHPRLYWGAVGNDLTPAFLELPISRNHRHGGWEPGVPFDPHVSRSAVTAVRTYDIFNENGWARSLHFLAAWLLVGSAAAYVLTGLFSGHIRRDLLPRGAEFSLKTLWRDVLDHLRSPSPPGAAGPPYNVLQKYAYCGVIFIALPLMVWTGLAMAPAVTAAYPWLSGAWGGSQSARTIHFFVFASIVLFVVVHFVMVILSGFKRQLRAMTWGS